MKEYYIIDRRTGKVVLSHTTTTQQACKSFIELVRKRVDADLVLCENVLGN